MATDAQIEAAARAIRQKVAERIWSDTDIEPTPWDKLKSWQHQGYRAEAKAALEAADEVLV